MTHYTERAGNEAASEWKVVTPTDLKSSPGFSADSQGERAMEKVRKKRDTKAEWERCKFY